MIQVSATSSLCMKKQITQQNKTSLLQKREQKYSREVNDIAVIEKLCTFEQVLNQQIFAEL